MSLRYPDEGQLLEDASILRNAVHFATEQRASVGYRILDRLVDPTDPPSPELLAFLAVDAFSAWMTSTEDILGWLFVFKEWVPGNPEKSLFPLLDRVQVGVGNYSEEQAKQLFDSLDADSLRALLHIPRDDELETQGYPLQVRERLSTAIPANLKALKRLIHLRQRENRGYVVAFNKLKHLMLAIVTDTRGRREVLVPGRFQYVEGKNEVHIQTAWIGCRPEDVRLLACRAIIGQAVLNSIIGIVLWTRFGQQFENPPWAVAAFSLPGWVEDAANQPATQPESS